MPSHRPGARPAWAPHLDRVAVVLFGTLWLAALLRAAPELGAPGRAVAAALGALLGYALADLVSGMVHWIADRYFEPTTPWIGPLLILPFREHHADASRIGSHDFFEISGNNALVTLPLALLALAMPLPGGPDATLRAGLHGLVLGLGIALFMTNQLHGWAHRARPPGAVRRLQRWGLILRPECHAVHHHDRHDRAYCVTSGWLNPVLDHVGLFPALERAIERLRRVSGAP